MGIYFWGYPREDGSYGVRNYVVVMASVVCANAVVEQIARQVPGVVPLLHNHGGCGEGGEITLRTLSGLGRNANVAAVLVVGLGCEEAKAPDVAAHIADSGKPVAHLVIQDEGGTSETIRKGVTIVQKMVDDASRVERVKIGLEHLTVAMECGGSDSFSGISANPCVGVASDLVVASGGTVLLSELSEMVGTAHLLKQRAISPEVAEKIEAYIKLGTEVATWRTGLDFAAGAISPGNQAGGLTNIVEKSLGCIAKAGTSTIMDCIPYGFTPRTKGLVIMETGGGDIDSMTGMVAGGAQIVVFTTGRGTPVGYALAPVIKVVSNSTAYSRMPGDSDINAGSVIDGDSSIEEVGRKIFDLVLEVANGQVTRAEINKQNHFAIRHDGFLWPSLKEIARRGL